MIEHSARYLVARGLKVRIVKTPSDDCRRLPFVRRYTHGHRLTKSELIAPICFMCVSDRLYTIRDTVLPMLEAGVWVICDRYVYTAMAEMQAFGAPAGDLETIQCLADKCFPRPDLAVITDIPPDISLQRVRARPAERNRPVNRRMWKRFAACYRSVATKEKLFVLATSSEPRESFVPLAVALDRLMTCKAGKQKRDGPRSTRRRKDAEPADWKLKPRAIA